MASQSERQKPRLPHILKELRQELPGLRDEYDLRGLAVYGAYARGEEEPGSPVDIIVEYERVPGLFRFIALEQRLSVTLGLDVHLVSRGGPKAGDLNRIMESSVYV